MFARKLVCFLVVVYLGFGLGECTDEELIQRWPSHSELSWDVSDYAKLDYIHTLKIMADASSGMIRFSLNNGSHMFAFPHVNRTFEYGELEENLVEVCFKMMNATNLALASKFKRLGEFCDAKFYDRLVRLDMSSNELTRFPSELLTRWFSHLEDLDLSNNSIESIPANLALHGRATLRRLDLSLNRIERLEHETLKNMAALRSLNLSKNQLKSVNMFTFASGAHTLVELDLSHNLITDQSMEFLVFSSFVNLRSLNMDFNRLSTLSNHWFYNLYNLEYLSLSHNNLRSFDLINFNSNEFLRVLDLSYNLNLRLDKSNSLTDDEMLLQQPPQQQQTSDGQLVVMMANSSLELLNLAGVDLGHVSSLFFESVLERFTRLRVLNLTSTRIKSLRPTPKWPASIEVLDLSSNFIRDEQFECGQLLGQVINLRRVYLRHNRFKSFQTFMRSCLLTLNRSGSASVYFDLRFNLFESLDDLISANQSRLSESCSSRMFKLSLQGNPLVIYCLNNLNNIFV